MHFRKSSGTQPPNQAEKVPPSILARGFSPENTCQIGDAIGHPLPPIVEIPNTARHARLIIKRCPFAQFVGVQKAAEFIGEDLILLRHTSAPRGAVIGIRKSQLNDFSILLAVVAQIVRYRRGSRDV